MKKRYSFLALCALIFCTGYSFAEISVEAERLATKGMRLMKYDHASNQKAVTLNGKSLRWSPAIEKPMTARLWVRCRSGHAADRTMIAGKRLLKFNFSGRDIEMVPVMNTLEYHGDGQNFMWFFSEPLNLDSGKATFVISAPWGYFHVDKLLLAREKSFTPPEGNVARNSRLAGEYSLGFIDPYWMPGSEKTYLKDKTKQQLIIPRGGSGYVAVRIEAGAKNPEAVYLKMAFSGVNNLDMMEAGCLPDTRGIKVSLHRLSKTGMRSGAALALDALPEVNEMAVAELQPGQSSIYWLIIRIAKNAKPGNYGLSIASENQLSLKSQSVQIEFKVANVTLRQTPDKLAIFNWWGQSAGWWGSNGNFWKDQISRGTNTFKITPQRELYYSFDKDGELKGKINCSRLDIFAETAKKNGGYLMLEWDRGMYNLDGLECLRKGAGSAKLSFKSKEWKKAFSTLVKTTTDYLVYKGVPREKIVQYIYDEYLGDDFYYVAGLLRKWDKRYVIYCNSVGSMDVLKKAVEYVDIWSPCIRYLEKLENDGRLDFLKRNGQVWCYDAGYLQRAYSPYSKYRYSFWITAKYGLQGCSQWKYMGDRVGFVYYPFNMQAGREKPVTSRRWEAWWAGVQDYMLLKRLEKMGDSKLPCSTEAKKLFDEALKSVTEHPDDNALAEKYRVMIIEFLEKNLLTKSIEK